MKNYIGSQEHWEDSINADYEHNKRMEKEQIDDREQTDDRKICYKTDKVCNSDCKGLCRDSM